MYAPVTAQDWINLLKRLFLLKEIIMKQLFNIIDNKLLTFDTNENMDWHFINNIEEMETYLYSQTAVDTCWLDLRENNSLILKLTNAQERATWDKEIVPIIQSRLKEVGYIEYLNDIEMDLFNCHLNITHLLKNKLWNSIFKAYKKGNFPCGWLGSYPEGKLVVFNPNDNSM